MSTRTDDSENVAVAFGLVIGAGAATAIGAAVVFIPALVKLASRRVLAGALGLSAGVMTYVSFVEIFQKSNRSFLDAGHSSEMAYIYATLCFFGGVVTMMIIDLLVKCLSGGQHHHHEHHHREDESCHSKEEERESEVDFVTMPHCACVSEDPVYELDEWKKRLDQEAHHQEPTTTTTTRIEEVSEVDFSFSNIGENIVENIVEDKDEQQLQHKSDIESASKAADESIQDQEKDSSQEQLKKVSEEETREHAENRRLIHMGINTAIAIGLHNFPEGLATFVAGLNDPRVGGVLAVAIGIHNIPEGLCVALPIYYATGNRCKAFLWACISGISEPFAALLGWAVLANSFSNDLYAVLFGVVAGMMVVISTKELLPTAHRYDPDDSVVTYSFIGGTFIMALSLVLFLL